MCPHRAGPVPQRGPRGEGQAVANRTGALGGRPLRWRQRGTSRPLDTDVLAEEDLNRYVAALERCWTNAAGGDLSGLGPFETLAVQVAQA
jgi:hypothetical protein